MKIIISGYGRMGKEVEKVAGEKGYANLVLLDTLQDWLRFEDEIRAADVVIDFSLPETAVDNIYKCFKLGTPVVTGTTGWYGQLDEIKKKCESLAGTLFYAPNFSIGVNVFFQLNRQLAKTMSKIEGYTPSITEIHHIHKIDAPSGTAIKLAEDIVKIHDKLQKWEDIDSGSPSKLAVLSKREGEVPGIHEVIYTSNADQLVVKHEAFNRSGFAKGALMAAEFVMNKKGVFTMDDLLNDLV